MPSIDEIAKAINAHFEYLNVHEYIETLKSARRVLLLFPDQGGGTAGDVPCCPPEIPLPIPAGLPQPPPAQSGSDPPGDDLPGDVQWDDRPFRAEYVGIGGEMLVRYGDYWLDRKGQIVHLDFTLRERLQDDGEKGSE